MQHEIVGRVEHLRVYPVKSAGALEFEQDGAFTSELQEVLLTPSGIETLEGVKDHSFLFVRADTEDGVHQKITQRDKRDKQDRTQGFSDLAHIRPQWQDGDLYLTWDGEDPVLVPLDDDNGRAVAVDIWGDICMAVVQNDDINRWASAHLNYPVFLVKTAGPFERKARQNYRRNDNDMLAHDGYPVHWLNTASVAELSAKGQVYAEASNGRVTFEQMEWQSFRPQVVVGEMPAQYEYTLEEGTIAGILFVDPKPCGRCTIPRVNWRTGEINRLDPNTVLASYMRWIDIDGDMQTIFGENMLPLGTGVVAVGDEIVTLKQRQPALVYGGKEIKS